MGDLKTGRDLWRWFVSVRLLNCLGSLFVRQELVALSFCHSPCMKKSPADHCDVVLNDNQPMNQLRTMLSLA